MARNRRRLTKIPLARCGKHPVRYEVAEQGGTYEDEHGQVVIYHNKQIRLDRRRLCGVADCPFTMYDGRWKCHICEGGPNTTGRCPRTVGKKGRKCGHECCDECEAF